MGPRFREPEACASESPVLKHVPDTAAVPARVSLVTLAVSDLPAMTRFYRQFGWPESKFSDESFVAFQTSDVVLGLFPATNYEEEFGARRRRVCSRDSCSRSISRTGPAWMWPTRR